jgi:hypothetical protein
MCAGTNAQRETKASPPASSRKKTIKFTTIKSKVVIGKFTGLRSASDKGIIVSRFLKSLGATQGKA